MQETAWIFNWISKSMSLNHDFMNAKMQCNCSLHIGITSRLFSFSNIFCDWIDFLVAPMPSSDCVWLDFELILSAVSSSSEDESLSDSDEQDDILLKSTLWNNRLIAFSQVFFSLFWSQLFFLFNKSLYFDRKTKSQLHQFVCQTYATPPQTHLQPPYLFILFFSVYLSMARVKKKMSNSRGTEALYSMYWRSSRWSSNQIANNNLTYAVLNVCLYFNHNWCLYQRFVEIRVDIWMRRLWRVMRRFHNVFEHFCSLTYEHSNAIQESENATELSRYLAN